MRASPFSIALTNLAELLPETSLYYTPKDEAYELLKQYSKQDFGMDVLKWEEWGRANDQFYPGWSGLGRVLSAQSDPEPDPG
jgi:hypothetical protein